MSQTIPQTAYCYHCVKHHPVEEMRLLVTKTGKRWRCLKSIEAAKQTRKAREAFGRGVTELNKAEAQAKLRIIKEAQL
ncbi:MAG: hypothetical protein WAO76_05255 [Georgfuchsia sp.]